MSAFAVVDLETTGLRVQEERIIEVGVLLVGADGREQQMLTQLVDPQRPLSSEVTRLTGISEAMLVGRPTFAQIAPKLAGALAGRTLIGHNIAAFDAPFLQAEFRRVGVTFKPANIIDTLQLSRRKLPQLRSHKLGLVCDHLGIRLDGAHRAAADVRATWSMYQALSARN
jgi:DNA polymerase III epsilon subunit family exonuclease